MHGRLHGKIALIVGAEGDIAAATALRFAREGARVALCGRDAERLEDTATRVADAGGSAYVLQADPGHDSQISAVLDEAIAQFGTVDVLVCCPTGASTIDSTAVGATTAAANKAAVAMEARGGGSIVLVTPPAAASEASHRQGADQATSMATLARRICVEGGARAVRTNVVVPGFIGTEETLATLGDPSMRRDVEQSIPLRRFGRPDEVAAVIAFLASDDAAYVNGATVLVDGGREARNRTSSRG